MKRSCWEEWSDVVQGVGDLATTPIALGLSTISLFLNFPSEVPHDLKIAQFKGLPHPCADDLSVTFHPSEPLGDPPLPHHPWRNNSGPGTDTVYTGPQSTSVPET